MIAIRTRPAIAVLTAAASVVALAVVMPSGPAQAGDTVAPAPIVAGKRPLALVYRGPASCPGCSEAAASLLRGSSYHFRIRYVGPREKHKLRAANFTGASLYLQPGGDTSVAKADRLLGPAAKRVIRAYVARGGHYLGICQGAYLAGSGPGMGLLSPGNTGQYIATSGAAVHNDRDVLVPVIWGGKRRVMYFQDGPYLTASHLPGEQVLARYTNGRIAALVKPFGAGWVGVVGPHPEAPASWYRAAGLAGKDPDGRDLALGRQLINATMSH